MIRVAQWQGSTVAWWHSGMVAVWQGCMVAGSHSGMVAQWHGCRVAWWQRSPVTIQYLLVVYSLLNL
jgi:hypothetical protein